MGDVTIILNNTSTGGGGDDEDNWNEISGSGDGEGEYTSYYSTKLPDRPFPHGPSGRDKGSGQDNLIIYIISASIVFVAIVIIIVLVVICCRKRSRTRRARLKAQLSGQGNEMKTVVPKRETRVFGDIAGGDSKDPQQIENERILSRLLGPPSSVAPPPPTTSKARAAPEAEKLLKANNKTPLSSNTHHNSGDRPQPKLLHLLTSEGTESSNHYEEIDNFSKVTGPNEEDNRDNSDHYLKHKTGSHGNKNIKDTHPDNKADAQVPVAKPRKNLGNVSISSEIGGYLEPKEVGSAV